MTGPVAKTTRAIKVALASFVGFRLKVRSDCGGAGARKQRSKGKGSGPGATRRGRVGGGRGGGGGARGAPPRGGGRESRKENPRGGAATPKENPAEAWDGAQPVSPRLELRAKLLAAAPQLAKAAQSYRRN